MSRPHGRVYWNLRIATIYSYAQVSPAWASVLKLSYGFDIVTDNYSLARMGECIEILYLFLPACSSSSRPHGRVYWNIFYHSPLPCKKRLARMGECIEIFDPPADDEESGLARMGECIEMC